MLVGEVKVLMLEVEHLVMMMVDQGVIMRMVFLKGCECKRHVMYLRSVCVLR